MADRVRFMPGLTSMASSMPVLKKSPDSPMVSKKFVSQMEVPENQLLPIVFFLTEQREYQNSKVESRIMGCFKRGDLFYYNIELRFNLQESDIIRTVKNMI
jgi:hypothetical protein